MTKLEKIRKALTESSKSFAHGDKLVERIQKRTQLDRLDVIKGLAELKISGEVQCNSWLRGEPIGKVFLNIQKFRSKSEIRWEKVLIRNAANREDIENLLPMSEKISDLSNSDQDHLYKGLCRLRSDIHKLKGKSRYIISSKYLLGSSKILDSLPSQCLRNFGIDINMLSGPPSYVIIAGPKNPECVVLIENPQALETAISIEGCKKVAWVATYGYGLSLTGDEYGRQLASIIEQGKELKGLVRSGSPPDISKLLTHPYIYFWGDLDQEGLRIFWRLKSSIPHLELSAIYHSMYLDLVNEESSHPYAQITGKNNQKSWECKNLDILSLLTACKDRAIDQECVADKVIEDYADKPLSSLSQTH